MHFERGMTSARLVSSLVCSWSEALYSRLEDLAFQLDEYETGIDTGAPASP